jgi:dienelactone hydrolase
LCKPKMNFICIQVEDVKAAVEFLRSRGLKVVAIVGHSKGAATVLLYHAKYNDVSRVAAVAPRFDQQNG